MFIQNGLEWNGMEWNGMEWNGKTISIVMCLLAYFHIAMLGDRFIKAMAQAEVFPEQMSCSCLSVLRYARGSCLSRGPRTHPWCRDWVRVECDTHARTYHDSVAGAGGQVDVVMVTGDASVSLLDEVRHVLSDAFDTLAGAVGTWKGNLRQPLF